MKKHVFNSILILSSVFTFAQNGPPWKPTGNNASTGDFLGTTNNMDLPIKTNNTTRFTFNANGDIVFNSLANSFNSSFLSIDQSGKVNSIDQNSLGLFQRNGNDYYITNGNLGIGLIPSSSFKLDVLGDARISNNLFVGGGVVITNKVDASVEVKAGDIIVNNDLSVTGNAKFSGPLIANQGITLDNSNSNIGIAYTPPSITNPGGTFNFGNKSLQILSGSCLTPNPGNVNPSPMYTFSGFLQSRQTIGLVNSALSMGSAPWDGSGVIEVEGTDNLGGTNNGLLINYFCHRNTYINTGWDVQNNINGGTVYMGDRVSMARNVGIGSSYPNPNTDVNVALNIHANDNNTDGIRLNIWNGTVKAFNLVHPSTNVSNFIIWQNGKTQIGHLDQKTGPYANAMLTVNGITVSKEIVVTQQNWADYVFSKDYQLPAWKETENYFKTNSHLKDVPTAKEILENGNNIGETSVIFLKKLEEAYLYIGGLHSDIEDLKKEIQELKKSNELLLKKN